ncbi:MAG: response regulator [Candidatus Marinimicrobia bacterium]|jgi:PAS domain S-box-containing protein|nr:response regulator [Candidatus Neomarinimicrobiota bacterium]MBT4362016.1 response regulator [Candidatus Neomarinimicrobiota bacterium]MBT4713393.1 response regulator [Candidatus Neomarinimicrobiota bacterium]MBT4945978.1 response regulator [Candidatus Neomarinimicrobiota bacterium]MBT5269652.1 response regulator [Candidatus Neomarinimicrobiota bacterium]
MEPQENKLSIHDVLDHLTDMIALTDTDYRIIDANISANIIIGQGNELSGLKCHKVIHDKDEPCDNCPLPESLETGSLINSNYFDERYGEFFEERTHPIVDDDGGFVGFIITIRNISDIRAAEDESAQSRRLASIGKLTAGAAHDFNNVMAELMGQIHLIKKTASDPTLLKQLDLLERSTRTGSDTIRRMLDFARGGRVTEMETLDTASLMQNVVYMTQARWMEVQQKAGVLISTVSDFEPDLYIAGSQSEIINAVTNLIFNGVDAMPDGGILTMSTSEHNGKVLISVQDTGTGMTKEVQSRIFDPFFSTKGSSGTGLGLSEVYGTIKRHDGDILVESEVGVGTKISLVFDKVENKQEKVLDVAIEVPPIRILAVDDNEFIIEMLTELLTDKGHTVSTHTSTTEAFTEFTNNEYDLVITDMEMPEMGGREFAELIKSRRKDIPVLLLSGWPIFLEEEPHLAEFIDFALAKPFTVEDIQNVILQALHLSD